MSCIYLNPILQIFFLISKELQSRSTQEKLKLVQKSNLSKLKCHKITLFTQLVTVLATTAITLCNKAFSKSVSYSSIFFLLCISSGWLGWLNLGCQWAELCSRLQVECRSVSFISSLSLGQWQPRAYSFHNNCQSIRKQG